jgi:hypothetical protein
MTSGEEGLEREQSQRKETKATHNGNGKSTARLSMGTEPEKRTARAWRRDEEKTRDWR